MGERNISRKLITTFMIFIAILAMFIVSVKVTEEKNNMNIKQNYSYSVDMMKNKNINILPPSKKAIEYQEHKVNLWLVNLCLGLIIPLIFLFYSTSLRNFCISTGKKLFLAFALYFIIYSFINTLICLPLDYYRGFFLKHAYGLSNQSFVSWIENFIKRFLMTTFIGAAFIWVPYFFIKKFPEKWWLYIGISIIPIVAFLTLITPMYIDPLFNKYESIQNKKLESRIYNQLDRTSIKNCNVYQVDKSKDTKEMNAYMTGILNSKRIVLWDTTIKQMSEDETLCVLAHEMGHYLMGHIWKAIILVGGLSIFLLYFINKSALWIIYNSNGRFGFKGLHDMATIPLLIFLINVFLFSVSPCINAYSRYTEREADRFELELTKDSKSAVSSTIKLHQASLTLPSAGIVYELWNYDHPNFEDRVKFSKEYKPWERGEKLKYENFIH